MSDNKPAVVPFEQVKEMAKSAASSGFFPGVRTPEQALVLMALAQAEGIAPITAMMRYDVIQGRPAKKSQAMLADFLSAGGKVEWLQHSDQCCEAKFSHPQGGEITVKWDLDKAKKAELLGKDNWKKHTENMLHARCVSNGVRFVYPAATGGLYDPTEVTDFEANKFENLPKEKPAPMRVENPGVAPLSLPALPSEVETIPIELCKGKFKPLAEFEGLPLVNLKLPDLEMIVALLHDNRQKVKDEGAKQWLTAIEARATELARDAKMNDAEFEDVK